MRERVPTPRGLLVASALVVAACATPTLPSSQMPPVLAGEGSSALPPARASSPAGNAASTLAPLPEPVAQVPEIDLSHSILFEPATGELSLSAWPVIESIASELKTDRHRFVRLIGVAGEETTDEYCVGTAAARVGAVRKKLIESGVRPSQIRRSLKRCAFASRPACFMPPCERSPDRIEFQIGP
jgi:hypothetical protein